MTRDSSEQTFERAGPAPPTAPCPAMARGNGGASLSATPEDPQDRLASATARLATTVLRLFRVRRVALYQREAGAETLVCIAAATDRDPHEWHGQRLPMTAGVAGRSYAAGTPVWIPDVLAEPTLRLPEWARRRIEIDGFRSVASVPVVVEGTTIGALSVSDVLGRAFADRDLEMLAAFAEQAATAIEKERLYEESERRRRAADALAGVGRLLLETLDPDAVAQRIADSVRSLLGACSSAVYRQEPGTGDLVAIAVSGASGPPFPPLTVFRHATGAAGLAIVRREPVTTEDILADPRLTLCPDARRQIEQAPYRAVIAVPLTVRGRVIGALGIGDRVGRVFRPDEVRLVEAFADGAALALENARLYAESEARRGNLQTLAEVAGGVARGIAVPALLDTIAGAAAALFGGEAAFRLVDGDFLVRAGATPGARTAMPLERIRIGESVSGLVALTGEPVSSDDIGTDPRVVEEHRGADRSDQVGAMLCVPLRTAGRTLGTLNVYRERGYHFDEHAVTLATLLANHAAVALENAELFSLEQLARARAEATADALRSSEEQYRALVDGSIQGMYIHQDGLIRFVNASLLRIFGYARAEELVGADYRVLIAPDHHARVEAYRTARLRGAATPTRYEARGVRKDGTEIWIETLVSVVPWEGAPAFLGTFLDITDRRVAEEALRQNEQQLRQAQKMEAIGQLAGGIAHDFNNLLTVITGRSQLLLRRIADDRARRDAQLIQMTAERAAALTKRLLAFSRKQTFHPVILDLGQLVEQLGPMLQRLLPEDIELVLRCHRELHTVRADPTQIEQVLLNLVVNAADAMPSGGCLLIETANVGRDEPGEPPPPGTAPAPSVRLSVTDTGTGMSEEIRSHLFEPFFTTKPPGKGTGLGLSTVYGIIQQHGGSISVQSTPGQGTTFTIDLPRADAERGVTVRRAPPESPAPGSETILLVEDEAEVRRLTREILEGSGYVVIEAGDPADALRLGQDTRRPIHLLLTDVVMPGMSGPELATRLTATRADLPVLFMSAYAPDAIRQRGMPGNGALIEKPFRPDALSRAVRSVLDGWTPAGAGPRSLVG